VVDPDVVARRVLALSEAVAHLRASGAGDAAKLAADPVLRAAAERWVQVSIEACIDVAYHVVAGNEWTPPDTARGAFQTLAAHGLLEPELARRLGLASGLRNLLIHDYVSVQLERLAQVIQEDLDDLSRFGSIASQWVSASEG